MKRNAIAIALTLCCAAPAAAQLPSWPNPLDALLREESRLHLRSSLTALQCCAHERDLDVVLAWPADAPLRGLGLRLLAGTSATSSDRYTRSGLEAVLGGVVGRVALSASAGVAVGGGTGPRRVWSAAFGADASELSVELRTTWLQDTPADSLLPGAAAPALVAAQYTEGEVHARHRLGRVEVSATGGIRFGSTLNDTPQWLSGEIDVPVWRRISLVTAAGLRPERPELAQAGGRFALLALRVHLQPREPAAAAPEPDSSAPAFVVRKLSPGKYQLRVRVDAARSVELTGDVTDWRVVPLRRVPNAAQWELTIAKEPGLYHVNIRIDGGAWIVPPGLPAVPDRFGGQSGLLHLSPVEELDHDEP